MNIERAYYESRILAFGVPQGSVVGLLLFTTYTRALENTLRRYCVLYNIYADDTQIYIAYDPKIDRDLQVKSSWKNVSVMSGTGLKLSKRLG